MASGFTISGRFSSAAAATSLDRVTRTWPRGGSASGVFPAISAINPGSDTLARYASSAAGPRLGRASTRAPAPAWEAGSCGKRSPVTARAISGQISTILKLSTSPGGTDLKVHGQRVREPVVVGGRWRHVEVELENADVARFRRGP